VDPGLAVIELKRVRVKNEQANSVAVIRGNSFTVDFPLVVRLSVFSDKLQEPLNKL
jgi:hypothetical protein